MNIWPLIKDILLTGTGVALIISQIFSQHPSDAILVAGLTLTVPTIAGHAKAVLSGPSGPSEDGKDEPTTSPKPPSSLSSGGRD